MKVLFLSAGKSIHTVRWVNSLSRRGLEVCLVYNKGHEPSVDSICERVQCYCLKYSGVMAYYLNAYELRKLTNMLKPDVINVHFASGYGTLARRAGIGPILLSVWGSDVYDFPNEGWIKNRILKKNINYAELLASTSNCMAEQLKRVMDNENLKIEITPFGVDTEVFNPELFCDGKGEEIVIGNIKILEPKYGIDVFIDSISILLDRLKKRRLDKIASSIKVKIYGEGKQRQELIQKTKDLNLDSIVQFCGRVANTEVPRCLAEFTIFCATSVLDSESFGVAVVEAMAMKVPVVTSDADGFCEVVSDRETGMIVPKKNAEKTAEALEYLILNKEIRKRMGESGRRRVEELYDWQRNVEHMVELYKGMMNRKNGRESN